MYLLLIFSHNLITFFAKAKCWIFLSRSFFSVPNFSQSLEICNGEEETASKIILFWKGVVIIKKMIVSLQHMLSIQASEKLLLWGRTGYCDLNHVNKLCIVREDWAQAFAPWRVVFIEDVATCIPLKIFLTFLLLLFFKKIKNLHETCVLFLSKMHFFPVL